MKERLRYLLGAIALLLLLSVSICGCGLVPNVPSVDLESIPEFDGSSAYVIINDNVPFFEEDEIVTDSYEQYGELDGLGRCTVASRT